MTDLRTMANRDRAMAGTENDWGEPELVHRTPRRQGSAQFSLRIDRPQIEALRRVANTEGLSFSDAARNAIAEYVARHEARVAIITGHWTIGKVTRVRVLPGALR